MTKYTFFKMIEQIYEKKITETLQHLVQNQEFEKVEHLLDQLYQNIQPTQELLNEVVERRRLKYQFILKNQNSIMSTLKQTSQIEEILTITFGQSHHPTVSLLLTCLGDFKKTFKRLAQLELKQIIMLLSFETYTKDEILLAQKFEQLLKSVRIDYRYLLGYDSIIGEEIVSSQISLKGDSTRFSNTTRIESSVFNRSETLNKKYDQMILSNLEEDTIPTLKAMFQLWKCSSKSVTDLDVIAELWMESLVEMKQLYQKKCQVETTYENDGQMDIWSLQKTKEKPSILDDSNN